MKQQNIFEYIRLALKRYGVIGRFLFVNALIYVFFLILQIAEYLFVKDGLMFKVLFYFAAPGDPHELIYRPWVLITHMFTHYGFGHFLFNMIVFFFTSVIFLQHFSEKRLVSTYFLGGIFAYIFHVGAYYVFPVFAKESAGPVIGASGAIMAIFMAIAIHKPSLRVMFFGIVPVPLILIAVLYLVTDLAGITEPNRAGGNNIAHFAHLGGAFFGAISVIGLNSRNHFMLYFDRFFSWFRAPKFPGFGKPRMKVYKGAGETKNMSDEDFNYNKKMRQERLDAILDKIRVKGYDGLTKEEKEFLFNESQRK